MHIHEAAKTLRTEIQAGILTGIKYHAELKLLNLLIERAINNPRSEKYLLIQHDPYDFLDYWLRDEILATSHKEAREILFRKHEIAWDDLQYTILKASEYKSKY